jgi:DNA topoisomerase-1
MAKKKKSEDAKNLMIVESPAKAKTLEKFLDDNFIVKSSYGHIRDLPKSDKAIDVSNRYHPTYEVSAEKKEVVRELKKLAKEANEVWLATDEDREGEAISWHLCEALGLDVNKAKRIVFHEITKPAILEAVKNPRKVDINLVNAQQARRILDRLVGFELSPILWRKIANTKSLSAGRVQSVAVRLIVEREREIMGFTPESSFRVTAIFKAKDKFGNEVNFRAELPKNKSKEKDAAAFLNACIGSDYTVKDVQVKPGKKVSVRRLSPTSTLQQEASRKLGYSVARTMLIAQRLYESGKITYMRTDSTNLSETALTAIHEEIVKSYGKQYSHSRKYTTKTANAQEAHEAIRPNLY